MHSHERLRALIAASGCTACGSVLDAGRIRVLAEREDLAFVETPCAGCGSTALAIVTGHGSDEPVIDTATTGELTPTDAARFSGAPPIDDADVRAIADLLSRHRGGLRDLVGLGPDRGAQGRPGSGA
ncbi:MAG TPA: hypothetical protein VEY67_07375 [Candidatus Dormibacteraeota bacterium]|nr:hypothetical protein [Candidatus Dormibacteraeota bacterium]